jgi:hypothetical protein
MTSEITIPSADDDPAAYVAALVAALGDRDAVAVLETTPAEVRRLASDLPQVMLERAPSPGEWSAREVLGHLLDVEVVYGFRMRLTLTEDEARYPGYNEKRWATLPRPAFEAILDAFTALRAANVSLLQGLPAEAWSRTGFHSEQGPDPFALQVRKLAGHDLAHLNQMERAIEHSRAL